MPVLSLMFAFLNFKHDKTIAVLRAFMAECEKLGSAKALSLPGYNSDDHYRPLADKYRNYHDYAAALLIFLYNAVGLLIAWASFPSFFDFTKWPIIAYVFGAAASIYIVMSSTWTPSDFSRNGLEKSR